MESSVTFLLASYYKDISLIFKGKNILLDRKQEIMLYNTTLLSQLEDRQIESLHEK